MMLLGVVLHSAIAYAQADFEIWPVHDPQTDPSFDGVVVLIHAFRMPIFFLIAGFFGAFLYMQRGPAEFVSNRRKRIWKPLYIFWTLLIVPTCWGVWVAMRKLGVIELDLPLAHLTIYIAVTATWLHLWFLYHLLWLYGAAWWLHRTSFEAPDRLFRRLLTGRFKALWLGLATAVLLLPMRSGAIDTSSGLIPNPVVLATHGLYFGAGWLLYRSRDLLLSLRDGAWAHLALAAALFPLNLHCLRELAAASGPQWRTHALAAVSSGLLIGLLVFAIMGLFLRYAASYNRVVRYLTDASYWMYLIHLPLLIGVTVWMIDRPWPAFGKFLFAQATVIPLLIVSYHYLVRATAIGALLNGRRYPRSLPPAEPAPARAAVG